MDVDDLTALAAVYGMIRDQAGPGDAGGKPGFLSVFRWAARIPAGACPKGSYTALDSGLARGYANSCLSVRPGRALGGNLASPEGSCFDAGKRGRPGPAGKPRFATF